MCKYLKVAAAVLLAVSCSVKEVPESAAPIEQYDRVYAAVEGVSESESKTYVDDQLRVLWHADDRISVFSKYTFNQEYQFTGQTGDNAGTFNKVESDVFVTGNSLPSIWAVYPYRESTKISNDAVLSVEFPATQSYAPDTFGRGAGIMVSATDDNKLLFKNAVGVLLLKLYGSGVSVNSVTLRGNKGEKLAGKATVTMEAGGLPSVSLGDGAEDELTLCCTDAVQIGASSETCTEFWLAMPPVDFTEGFTMTVEYNGGSFDKSTSNAVNIVRNRISSMAPIEIEVALNPVAVDLGLSVKWAACNVGAASPEGYGDYFAWAETETKSNYSWATYKWCNGDYNNLTKYCSQYSYGTVDGKKTIEPEDDAAKVKWGEPWRMPTNEEWDELYENCTWTWTAQNGTYGYMVTSNMTGFTDKSIFLPAAGNKSYDTVEAVGSTGFYWSSNTVSGMSIYAYYVELSSGSVGFNGLGRYFGFPVRPVCE